MTIGPKLTLQQAADSYSAAKREWDSAIARVNAAHDEVRVAERDAMEKRLECERAERVLREVAYGH